MSPQNLESRPLAAAGMVVSAVSTGAAAVAEKTGHLIGAVDVATIANYAGVALAFVFGGLIPKGLDAWQTWRQKAREEAAADRAAFIKQLEDLHKMIVEQLKEEADRLRAQIASLQRENAQLTKQSQAAIVGEVQHVNNNVKNAPALAEVLGEKLGDRVVNEVKKVASETKKVASATRHIAEGLSDSGIGINMDDSDPDAPTIQGP